MDLFVDYKKIRNQENILWGRYFLILLFIISPLISLPFIFIEIYNKKSYAFTLLALFMGLVALLFPPVYDLYRHYLNFIGQGFESQVVEVQEARSDFILPWFNSVFNKFGLPFGLIRFIFVTVSYQILFWIFLDVVKQRPNLNKYFFRLFLIVFLSVQFFSLTLGLRFMESTFLFFLGMYLIIIRKNNLGYIPLVLCCCLHFSYIGFVFIFIILKRFPLNISAKKIIITSLLLLLIINPAVITFVIEISPLPAGIKILAKAYCLGLWGNLEERSMVYIIAALLDIILLFPLIFIVLRLPQDKFSNLARISIIILAITYGFSFTFFYRFCSIFILFGLTSYLLNFQKFSIKWVSVLLVCSSIMMIGSLYKYRREFNISQEYKLLAPIPFILASDYSYQWVKNTVNVDGYLFSNPKK